nr:fasciclin domain-containing protein [uncultured Flavobacterium sp.]
MLVIVIAFGFQNCSEDKIANQTTDNTLNITDYIRQNEDYSMFLEILDITNYASFMNTYGTYTVFVPTNAAVSAYLNDKGVSSLNELPLEDLQNLAKLHILDQKILTTSFTDGKIEAPSLYGQFLVTGATSTTNSNSTGTSSITVNKTSKIVTSNIVVGNGVIHVIDKVLIIANKTLAQTIEEDSNLSLFTEVLKATGWFDKLNKPITRDENNIASYLSVLAQTNEAFSEAGYTTLDQLKAKYSHLGDPTKLTDSLNLFVSYRIIPGLQYLADFAVSPALETMAPFEVISSKLSNGDILLNNDVFNGIEEKGVSINRALSDLTCSNGVLHIVNESFSIKKRLPMPVYWELSDIAEFRKVPTIWRAKDGGLVSLFSDQVGIDLTFTGNPTDSKSSVNYSKAKDGSNLSQGINMCWGADVLEIPNFRDANVQDVILKTPVIVKGRYKLWISYRANGVKMGNVKVFFDGKELPRTVNLSVGGDTSAATETELESQGYKRYLSSNWSSRVNCRLVGIIDVQTTSRHTLMLQSQGNFGGQASWFDIAEFRPIEMDQLYPKFVPGQKGLVYRP